MAEVTIFHSSGFVQSFDKEGVFSLDELEEIVEGQIAVYSLSGDDMLVVNDLGIALNLPCNERATEIWHQAGREGNIYGNALICPINLL